MQAVTCSQLGKVLQVIGTQTQLRCSVIVALWNKVLDRQNLVKVNSCCMQRGEAVPQLLRLSVCRQQLVATAAAQMLQEEAEGLLRLRQSHMSYQSVCCLGAAKVCI